MSDPSSSSPLCGIVVIYHPGEVVVCNVRAMLVECGRVLVMDNGSSAEVRAKITELAGVSFLDLGGNLGIAAALNRGAAYAKELGFSWMVTFDQDSCPEPGMVRALWATHQEQPKASIVAPRISEEGVGLHHYRWIRSDSRWPLFFRRIPCRGKDLTGVSMAITSGSLTEINSWRELGGFDDEFFIDYVDVDFCHKVVCANREIAVSANAILRHRLGERRNARIFGVAFRPTYHAPFRHYYISRNRVTVWRRYAWRLPHWAIFDLTFACFNFFRVVAFEDQKLSKIKAMMKGTWDGLRGRTGPLKSSPF
jgi:rhamnosyltransferase